MTDRGLNNKRTDSLPSTSSSSRSSKKLRINSTAGGVPIDIPNNNVTVTTPSSFRKSTSVGRPKSNSSMFGTQRPPIPRHILTSTRTSSSSREKPIVIADQPTDSESSQHSPASKPAVSHLLATDKKLQELRAANIHKVFPRQTKEPAKEPVKKPPYLEGMSDDDDEDDDIRKSKDQPTTSTKSSSTNIINIDSDEEDNSQTSIDIQVHPHSTTPESQSSDKILKYLGDLRSNTTTTTPRPRLVDALRSQNASTSAGSYSKEKQFKKQVKPAASKSVEIKAFGPNPPRNKEISTLTLNVSIPPNIRPPTQSINPFKKQASTTKASPANSAFWRSTHSPSTKSASYDAPRGYKPTTAPLASYLPSTKKTTHEKEIIEVEDDSSDDDDFQSAPNSPPLVDVSKDSVSKKTTDASSASSSPYISNDPLLLSSRTSRKRRKLSKSDDVINGDNEEPVKVENDGSKKKEKETQLKDKEQPKHLVAQNPVERMFKYTSSGTKAKTEDAKPQSSSSGSVFDFGVNSNVRSVLSRFGRSITGKALGTPIETPKSRRSPSPSPPPPPQSASPKKSCSSLFSPPSYLTDPDKEVLVYPFSGKKAVVIKNSDLARVKENKFLNDSIMDAYPKILQDEHPRDEIYTFSSFFFTRLTQPDSDNQREKSKEIKYENVRRWTDKINIFEKKYLIIPIEQEHHWFLAIVTNPGYCAGIFTDEDEDVVVVEGVEGEDMNNSMSRCYITLLDSLGSDRELCYNQICDYLLAEATNRLQINPSNFQKPRHVKGRAPLQTNLTDCGVHCLYSMKCLFKDPSKIQQVLVKPSQSNDYIWEPNEAYNFRGVLNSIFRSKARAYAEYKKKEEEEEGEEKEEK